MADDQQASQLQTPADTGTGGEGYVRRWLIELALADKAEKAWRETSSRIVARYRGESLTDPEQQKQRADSYNVLYANVQTLQPILYNSTPEPVVQRRFKDADPIAKAAGEVLQRALKYTIACQDFDEVMLLACQDYLLPGRAVVSVKYVPTTDAGEDQAERDPDDDQTRQPAAQPAPGARGNGAYGNAPDVGGGAAPSQPPAAGAGGDPASAVDGGAKTEEVVYEEIRFDLTPWKSFRRGPGRTWQDVPWIAFELELTREACVDLFGDAIGNAIPLRTLQAQGEKTEQIDRETAFQRAQVWQIWDKAERTVCYICPDFPEKPCKVAQDEYNLSGFYNVPRPLYAVETSDSLVPVAEFTLYKSLADEAETLTNRMSRIARAIRVRGGYAAGLPEIQRILESEETDLIPVKNADEWAERGGLANAVWMWPVEQLVATYQALGLQRELVKQSIYEILGVADIMRGATDPQETATSQTIKVRWGSLRTRRRQAEVQRFVRDLMRIAGEMIAEKFSQETLAMITGLPYPTQQQKALVQQVVSTVQQRAQQPQQPGQPPAPQIPPEIQQQAQQMLAMPTWEEIIGFLRNDPMRHFRIDIQTDSTIALQDGEDQADFAKMIGGVTQLFNELGPAVQQGILPFEAAKAMMLSLTRKFRLGTEIEDQLSQMQQPAPPDPTKDPKFIAEQAKAQASAQAEQARAQADVQIEREKGQIQIAVEQQRQMMEAKFNAFETIVQGLVGVIERHVGNIGVIEAARIKAGYDAGADILTEEIRAANQQPNVPGMGQPGTPMPGGMPQ